MSSLSLCCPCLSLRFASTCLVFAFAVCSCCAACCRCAFSSRYGFHSCHAMPGTMPLLRLVRASSRRFPFPFSLYCSDHVLLSSFPISLCFLPLSLAEPARRKLQVAATTAWPWMSSVYVERQSDFIVREGSKRTMD